MTYCNFFKKSGFFTVKYSCALKNFTTSKSKDSELFNTMEKICKTDKNINCTFKGMNCPVNWQVSLAACDHRACAWDCKVYGDYLENLTYDELDVHLPDL